MEKEAGVLTKEMKITLTFQKQVYAVLFAVILSLVRGVVYSDEIGIALEPPLAVLVLTFCADTYTQEIASRRSEVWRLCPAKRKIQTIYKRLAVQELFLLSVAAFGYGLFLLFQNPVTGKMTKDVLIMANVPESEIYKFLVYLAALAVTIFFWGMLSNLLSCLFRNMWAGIGACLILWLTTNSAMGDRILGAWNLFSYTFRELGDSSDFSWLCGKMVCICMGITAMTVMPEIIEKRG